jgi:hypothetical protein
MKAAQVGSVASAVRYLAKQVMMGGSGEITRTSIPEPSCGAGVESRSQRYPLGQTKAQEGPMTVFAYVNTSKQVGDPEHLKVFATTDAAENWFEENDPEGVAFEYEVLE